jgi:pyruvate/2-oxoglutarate/acetoin dehydrogenase E1 component
MATQESKTEDKSYIGSIIESYHEALREHDDTFVIGEDIEHAMMGTTRDLVTEFGQERVRDAPISEQGFTGLGIGAAMAGKRPILEYQVNPIPHLAMDQLVNNAQKLHHMTGGQVSVPLTITVPSSGSPGGSAAQHSEDTYPQLLNFGMKVVIPSTPYDQKGLFRSALEEDDPVIIFWPGSLMGARGEVPVDYYEVPLGSADVKREGEDLTIIATGKHVPIAQDIAEEYDEASIEVVDPRSLLPLDEETIFESVKKTGRVVVVDQTNRYCGAASEIGSRISNGCFWYLDTPVKRVTRADVPISYSPPQEEYVLPDEDTIKRAVDDVLP